MQSKRIVLLAGEWETTSIVYNFLQQHFSVEKVIIEKPVPRKEFLRKRIKKQGWITVGGQVMFQLLIGKLLAKTSRKRIEEILEENELSQQPIPEDKIARVASVNSELCKQLLQELNPDLVVVHGTRIISKKILTSISGSFMNIHAGITPRYRGSHGAYWALVNNDKENCGVTVHLVDPGIDTGNILFQERIPLSSKDNFATYSYLQLATGLQLLKKAIGNFIEGKIETMDSPLDSKLWYHPTLWSYVYKRLFKKVK